MRLANTGGGFGCYGCRCIGVDKGTNFNASRTFSRVARAGPVNRLAHAAKWIASNDLSGMSLGRNREIHRNVAPCLRVVFILVPWATDAGDDYGTFATSDWIHLGW